MYWFGQFNYFIQFIVGIEKIIVVGKSILSKTAGECKFFCLCFFLKHIYPDRIREKKLLELVPAPESL